MSNMNTSPLTIQAITELDQNDPLRHKRDAFALPAKTIYLDGNSLGALPKTAIQRAKTVVEDQWGTDLIASWNKHQWIDLPVRVGEKIAPLIGAQPGQVVCCDSISVNLFKLLSGALSLQAGRTKIVSQQDNFPTDLYMVQGLQSMLGADKCHLHLANEEDIEAALDESVAVLLLTQVNFRSGRIHDMQRLTELAHQQGILVIWDLAHSAGAIPVHLDQCNVDFAVGCGYKYLNGGPGAPAFIYIAKRLQSRFSQPISGWMGHSNPFAFDVDYQAGEGVTQCLAGTPAIISMSILDAALDVFSDVSMQQIRQKSIELTELFIRLFKQFNLDAALTLLSPAESIHRGSQIALCHPHAYAICQALIADKIIVDYRAPDVVRFGFTPLYTQYVDIYHTLCKLNEIINAESFLQAKFNKRAKVT